MTGLDQLDQELLAFLLLWNGRTFFVSPPSRITRYFIPGFPYTEIPVKSDSVD
jgi:hypothetical protein